jgi:hypothetical protein
MNLARLPLPDFRCLFGACLVPMWVKQTMVFGRQDYHWKHNIFYANGTRGIAKGAHSTTADPKFIEAIPAAPLDVKLQRSSPAIHTGSTLSSTYKRALHPSSAAFPCSMLDQTQYGWNRGAFGSE